MVKIIPLSQLKIVREKSIQIALPWTVLICFIIFLIVLNRSVRLYGVVVIIF